MYSQSEIVELLIQALPGCFPHGQNRNILIAASANQSIFFKALLLHNNTPKYSSRTCLLLEATQFIPERRHRRRMVFEAAASETTI
jgi:hypothetical protein